MLMLRIRRSTLSRRVQGATGSEALGGFWGETDRNSFSLRRITARMGAFEPVIKGVVESDGSGCRILLTLTPQPEVNRILASMCLFLALCSALCLWQIMRTGFRALYIAPILLLALGYFMPRAAMRRTFREAKDAISRIL